MKTIVKHNDGFGDRYYLRKRTLFGGYRYWYRANHWVSSLAQVHGYPTVEEVRAAWNGRYGLPIEPLKSVDHV